MALKIITSFEYPPIPIRNFDWSAVTDGYDGAPDAGPQLVGHGATEAAAIQDLMLCIEEAGRLDEVEEQVRSEAEPVP